MSIGRYARHCIGCLAIGALACSSSPDRDEPATRVLPYGKDRFFVAYQSNFGPAKAKTNAIRDANRYCTELGGSMEPIESETTGAYPVVTFELLFSCKKSGEAEPSDPQE